MGLAESNIMPPMKYWEIVADKLSAAGWSWVFAAGLHATASSCSQFSCPKFLAEKLRYSFGAATANSSPVGSVFLTSS